MGVEASQTVAEHAPGVALGARSLTIPTDDAEAGGTLSCDSATLVVAETLGRGLSLRGDEAERFAH